MFSIVFFNLLLIWKKLSSQALPDKMVPTSLSCFWEKGMRCMELCVVPVPLTAGGSSISSKILRFTERNCSYIMPISVMMPLFAESFPKPNQMSSTILPVRVMWASVLKYRRLLLRKLQIVLLNYLRFAGTRAARQKSIWPVPPRFLGILRTLPRMKILTLTPRLLTGLQKLSVCTRVIFIGSLINYLSVMGSFITMNPHVVEKTLLPKKLFVGQHLSHKVN